jgi:hypothetical protein
MRTTKDKPGIRPTPLHYLTSTLALALVCCSLLCIYLYTTPTHASTGSQQANGQTMSGQLPFDETETETPPPTATSTPSPTVTTTPSPTATTPATPTPSPSVTRTTTPSPTPQRSATPTATVRPSPATTGMQTPSPGATPTSKATSITITALGAGANQTPVTSPAPMNNQSDQVSQGAHHTGNTFPFPALMIGLGSLALLGLLLIPGWMIARRCLLPAPLPKLPPSGAAPWSRTRISDPPDSLHALPTMADVPVTNLPAFSSRDHAAPAAAGPVSNTNPSAGSGQPFDSSYLAARIRQRRNELRATANLPAFQNQVAGKLSAEIAELNDPYLRSLIRLYSVTPVHSSRSSR